MELKEFLKLVRNNEIDKIKEIFNQIKIKHSVKNTALLIASKLNFELSKFLLENGADYNCRDDFGNTPLMLASRENFELVQYLIENTKININLKNQYHETALTHSILNYDNDEEKKLRIKLIQFLMNYGKINIDYKNLFNEINIDLLDEINFYNSEKFKITKYLIKNGAIINFQFRIDIFLKK
jgi:ankyrin repeat protein